MTQDGQEQDRPFKILELDFSNSTTRLKEEYVKFIFYILKHAT